MARVVVPVRPVLPDLTRTWWKDYARRARSASTRTAPGKRQSLIVYPAGWGSTVTRADPSPRKHVSNVQHTPLPQKQAATYQTALVTSGTQEQTDMPALHAQEVHLRLKGARAAVYNAEAENTVTNTANTES